MDIAAIWTILWPNPIFFTLFSQIKNSSIEKVFWDFSQIWPQIAAMSTHSRSYSNVHAFDTWGIMKGVEYVPSSNLLFLCESCSLLMPRVRTEAQLESDFQRDLIDELELMFPGILILKNDEQMRTGIPDLTLLYKNKWAMLEVKAAWDSGHRPLQDYYIDMCDGMSYGAFIFPENKDEILDEIQATFRTARSPRVSKSF